MEEDDEREGIQSNEKHRRTKMVMNSLPLLQTANCDHVGLHREVKCSKEEAFSHN